MSAPDYPSTVGRVLERTARRVPEKLALTFAQRSWTYAELDQAAGRVAAGLIKLGLEPGDRVAAFGKNSDAYLLLYLGCARAGLVHVPVNFNARDDELVYLLTQSSPRIAFHDPALTAVIDAVDESLGAARLGTLRDGDPAARTPDVLAWALDDTAPVHAEDGVRDEDLAQLLYTSGTTSMAKGAMMTHRAFVHEYVSAITALDLHEHDVQLHSLPLYHSAQMHVKLLPGLAVGATNHLLESPDLDEIFERIPRDRVDVLFLAPTVWVGFVNHPRFDDADLSSLRRAFYGASIMPMPILERLRARMPQVGFYNLFGQSEIGPLATVLRPEEHAERPDSVGRSVLFVETRVVDEQMHDVAPGELGEVIYRSPQLCRGYWGKPEETAEAFRGGWFHSGDLVRIDAQGYMFVVDRLKDVINTGGVLVASREVEDALYDHPAVAEVAVIGLPHEVWIEAIAAVVVVHQDASVSAEELVAFGRERLPGHKAPKSVHIIEELPKNASGKLLKRELRERFGGSASAVGGR
ncbi:MAG: fatty acyl-CoA synthetase [Solirubrobacteraceae bacterium]